MSAQPPPIRSAASELSSARSFPQQGPANPLHPQLPRREPAPASRTSGPVQQPQVSQPPQAQNAYGFDIIKSTSGHFVSKKEFFDLQRLKSAAGEPQPPQVIPQKPPEGSSNKMQHQDVNMWSNPAPQQVTPYADARVQVHLPNQRRPQHTNQHVTHPSHFESSGPNTRPDPSFVHRPEHPSANTNAPPSFLPSIIPDKQNTQRHPPGGPAATQGRVEDKTTKEPKPIKKQKPVPSDPYAEVGPDFPYPSQVPKTQPIQRTEDNSSFGTPGVPDDSKPANIKKAKPKNAEQPQHPAGVSLPSNQNQNLKSQKQPPQAAAVSTTVQSSQKKNVLANSRHLMQAEGGYEDPSFEHQPNNLLDNDYNESSRTGQIYHNSETFYNSRPITSNSEQSGYPQPNISNRPMNYHFQDEQMRPPVPGTNIPGVPKKDSKKNNPQQQAQKKSQPQKNTEALPVNEQQTKEADTASKKLPKKPKASPPEDTLAHSIPGRSSARPPAGDKLSDSGQGLTPNKPARSGGKIDGSQLSKIRHLQDQVKLLEDSCVQLESYSRSIGIGIEFYLEYDWVKFVEKVRSYLSEVQKVDAPPASGPNTQIKLSEKRLSILETSVSKKLAHIELVLQSETQGQADPAKETQPKDYKAPSTRPAPQVAGDSQALLDPASQSPVAKPLEAGLVDRKPSPPAQTGAQSVEPTAATKEAKPSQPLEPVAEPDAYQDHYAFLSANSRETARVHQDFIKQNLTHSSYGSFIFSPFAYRYSPVPQYSVAAYAAPQPAYQYGGSQYPAFDGYLSTLQDPQAAEAFGAVGASDAGPGLDPQGEGDYYYGDPGGDYYSPEYGHTPHADYEAGELGVTLEAEVPCVPQENGPVETAVAEGLQAVQVAQGPVLESAGAGLEAPGASPDADSREEALASGSVFRPPDHRLESAGFISNIALVGLAADLHADNPLGLSACLFGRLPAPSELPVSGLSTDPRPNTSNGFSLFAPGPARKDSNEQKKVSEDRDVESSSGSLSRRELLFNSDDESSQEHDRRSAGEAAGEDILQTLERAEPGFSGCEAQGPQAQELALQAGTEAGLRKREPPALPDQAEKELLCLRSEQSAEDRIPETHHTEAPAVEPETRDQQPLESDLRAARDRVESSPELSNPPRSEGNSISDKVDALREQLDDVQASQRNPSDGEAKSFELESRQLVQDSPAPVTLEPANETQENTGDAPKIDHRYRQASADHPADANNAARPAPDSSFDLSSRFPALISPDGSIHPDSNEPHPSADQILEQQISEIYRPEADAKLDQMFESHKSARDGNPESLELPSLTMNQQSVISVARESGPATRRDESAALVDGKDLPVNHATRGATRYQSQHSTSFDLPEKPSQSECSNLGEFREESENKYICTEIVDTEANDTNARLTRHIHTVPASDTPNDDPVFLEKRSEAGSSGLSHQAQAQDSSSQPSLIASEGAQSKSKHSEASGRIREQKAPVASAPRIALVSNPRSSNESVSGKGLAYHRSKLEEECQKALDDSMASVRKVLETYASRRAEKKTVTDYFTREENPENLSLFEICTNPNYAVVVKKKINKLSENERIDFFYQIKPFLMELAADSIGILVIYTLISMSSLDSPDIKNIAIEMLIFFFLKNLWAFCRDPLSELIYRYVFDVRAC